MPEKINQFLDSVCAHIKYKSIHQEVRDELHSHINELKDVFSQETQDEESALDMAITAMGDCDIVGKNLNKQHQPQTEWSLIGLATIIALIGGIVMYMSSYSIQTVNFERYLTSVLLGIGVMVSLYFFDYTKLKKLALLLYLLSLAVLVFGVKNGQTVNGQIYFFSSRIGFISSQLIIMPLLISFAGFVDAGRGKGGIAIIKLLIFGLIASFLMLRFYTISLALTFTFLFAVILIIAVLRNHFYGRKKLQLICLTGTGSLFGLAFFSWFILDTFRLNRILYFFSKEADPLGSGYQQKIADMILSTSNFFGKTTETLNGRGIIELMPEITTNYALVNVIATLGWATGIVLVLTVAAFVCRMLSTTRRIKNSYGFYLSLSACSALSFQFMIGIMLNFNLLPAHSVSIPFVSYGGTGYIISMALVGIILSIWRRNNLIPTSTQITNGNVDSFIKYNDGRLIINFRT